MTSQYEAPANRVAYRWEEQDYVSLGRFIVNDTPIGKQILRQQFMGLILLTVLLSAVAAALLPDWILTALVVAVLIIFIPVNRHRMAQKAGQAYGKAMRPLDPAFIDRDVEVVLQPDAMELTTGWKSSRYAWRAVLKVMRDDANFYALMVDRNSLVVPLRAFHGTAHFQAFYDLAVQYHRQAHEQTRST